MEEMNCPKCEYSFYISSNDENYYDGKCPSCGLEYHWEEEYDPDSGEDFCYRMWGEFGEPFQNRE